MVVTVTVDTEARLDDEVAEERIDDAAADERMEDAAVAVRIEVVFADRLADENAMAGLCSAC